MNLLEAPIRVVEGRDLVDGDVLTDGESTVGRIHGVYPVCCGWVVLDLVSHDVGSDTGEVYELGRAPYRAHDEQLYFVLADPPPQPWPAC